MYQPRKDRCRHRVPCVITGFEPVDILDGIHRLEAPSDNELALALDLADRYVDTRVDLPDLTVMAMATSRSAWILTWDYRDFRTVVLHKGHHWDLLVQESELPQP